MVQGEEPQVEVNFEGHDHSLTILQDEFQVVQVDLKLFIQDVMVLILDLDQRDVLEEGLRHLKASLHRVLMVQQLQLLERGIADEQLGSLTGCRYI